LGRSEGRRACVPRLPRAPAWLNRIVERGALADVKAALARPRRLPGGLIGEDHARQQGMDRLNAARAASQA